MKATHLREQALRLGFSDMSFLPAQNVSREFEQFYKNYLQKNLHGSLHYLENWQAKKHPQEILADVKQLLVFTHPYRTKKVEELSLNFSPRPAYYAWGDDYHWLLKNKMRQLIENFLSPQDYRTVADSTPLPERYWARQAGLGFIGRHGNLIHPHQGSFLLLSFLLLKKELLDDDFDRKNTSRLFLSSSPNATKAANEVEKEIEHYCGSCNLCRQVCPGNAILGDGTIQTSQCVSFITTQSKLNKEQNTDLKKHPYLYGCDLCQRVCPYNRYSVYSLLSNFEPHSDVIEFLSHLQNKSFANSSQAQLTKKLALAYRGKNKIIQTWKNMQAKIK